MRDLLTRLLGCTQPEINKDTAKVEVAVDNQAKEVLIPAALDITRTKEFWDNAVPS